MSSKRCPSCGLVNFAEQNICRRCNTDLEALAASVSSVPAFQQPHPAGAAPSLARSAAPDPALTPSHSAVPDVSHNQPETSLNLHYPLRLSFKLLALAPQIMLTDSSGNLVLYVKQKLFKLKEEVTVFADAEQTQALYKINADRMLDFSANYHFSDLSGHQFGSVRREGMRSLWKAHYDIFNGSTSPLLNIREENGWIKVLDALFSEIPIVGLLSGYVFNPTYLVARPDGQAVMRLSKQPSLLQKEFSIEKLTPLSELEEVNVLLSLLMMTLLERARG